jgi:hypothetical protein
LPDCVALGLGSDEEQFLPYLLTSAASVRVVVMPVSSNKLLVGTHSRLNFTDLSNFNSDAIACSNELFIAATQTQIFAELGLKKGERWKNKIDTHLQRAFKERLLFKDNPEITRTDLASLTLKGYQLTFVGFNAEADVIAISDKAQHIVSEIRTQFNLDRLDGITFTKDFQTTLRDLERGFDISVSPEWSHDLIAAHVATAIVVRDGATKVRIVLDAEYGLSLVDTEPQDQEVALHFIVAGLAQACTLNQIENDLPGFLLEPVLTSNHDGVLHCFARKALRAYRFARDSAKFGAGDIIEKEFSKYLSSAFASEFDKITQAKVGHSILENFPELFQISTRAVENILISAARLIGHRHGVGKVEILAQDTEAGIAIASRQLGSWMEVFAKDLRRFWQKGSWTEVDFYSMNIHVERLLWANGILVWRNPNGACTTIMPIPNPA